MKRALITGITGQDGSYLAELLLGKGYMVYGLVRRNSSNAYGSLTKETLVSDRLVLLAGDMTDTESLEAAIRESQPDEIYNLAAMSHVGSSFKIPTYTSDVIALGADRLLKIISRLCLKARIYQASTSELFGDTKVAPQNESTPFNPNSPYACAKLHAFHAVCNYRRAYGLFACNGILGNHESPRRSKDFVTRKITSYIGKLVVAHSDNQTLPKLKLGNLSAKRDWGYAPEYMEAAWLILQQPSPDDYVIGTGETHEISEFVIKAFGEVGLIAEDHIEIDPAMIRPSDVNLLQMDASKARQKLGWEPKVKFDELIKIMVEADIVLAEKEFEEGKRYGR